MANPSKLTAQDKAFVKEVSITGNATQAVKKVYGEEDDNYAGVKGHRLLSKDKIQKAIQSIADQIPDSQLVEVHLGGLTATSVLDIPDYSVRHKYLDSAYKLKGAYAPDKTLNVNINMEIDPVIKQKLDEALERYVNNG